MKVSLARGIDYYLGLPLCFLFSLLNLVFRLPSRLTRKKPGLPKAILFIKLPELGTIILSYPLLKRIKEEYPDADLFFLTFKKNKDILKILGQIIPKDNIFTIREDSLWKFGLDTIGLIAYLRFKKIDIIFDLEFFSRFSAILAYLIGAEKRVGFARYNFEGLYRGSLLTHKVLYNPLEHTAKNYLIFSQVVKSKNKNTPELAERIEETEIAFPSYNPEEQTRERMRVRLTHFGVNNTDRLFLIHPGEGILPLREWPLDYFISLCRKILENPKSYPVLIGTPGASSKARFILNALNNTHCLDLTGQTTLEELLNLFTIADILISNDCGLAHLAMLTPIKKFILFGPESPQVFAPLGQNNRIIYAHWPCSPCLSVLNHRLSSCADNLCLKAIKPERVYELVGDV